VTTDLVPRLLAVAAIVVAFLGYRASPAAADDCNTNGIPDDSDLISGTSMDCNTNGLPDECDLGFGSAADCNTNGSPDLCDLGAGSAADCNTNGLPDICGEVPWESGWLSPFDYDHPQSFTISSPPPATDDVAMNFTMRSDLDSDIESVYVDINGITVGQLLGPSRACVTGAEQLIVPADVFNSAVGGGNAVIHMVPTFYVDGFCPGSFIQASVALLSDCNDNGVPDECDLANGVPDCNTNGLWDPCEAAMGTALDCDSDGLPDECEADCNTNQIVDDCELAWGESGPNAPSPPWDNGQPDGVNGFDNVDLEVADDFVVLSETTIAAIAFSDLEEVSFDWTGSVLMATWSQRLDGKPSSLPMDEMWAPDDGGFVSRAQNGTLFNRPRWDYTILTHLKVDSPGVNFVSVRPIGLGTAYWLTSAVPAQFGNSYVRGIDFYPDWLPIQELVGENYDFAFTLTFGAAMDCNTNGQVDTCEIGAGSTLDTNCSGVPDECDLPADTSADCNTNDLADACEGPDCNLNGILDICEIAAGTSGDSDGDGVLDECEPPPCETCPGDLSGDDLVDGDDVPGFVACLAGGSAEPPCGCTDMDDDQALTEQDLAAFIAKLLGDADTPCP